MSIKTMMMLMMNLRFCSCGSHPSRAPPLFGEGSADLTATASPACGAAGLPGSKPVAPLPLANGQAKQTSDAGNERASWRVLNM